MSLVVFNILNQLNRKLITKRTIDQTDPFRFWLVFDSIVTHVRAPGPELNKPGLTTDIQTDVVLIMHFDEFLLKIFITFFWTLMNEIYPLLVTKSEGRRVRLYFFIVMYEIVCLSSCGLNAWTDFGVVKVLFDLSFFLESHTVRWMSTTYCHLKSCRYNKMFTSWSMSRWNV